MTTINTASVNSPFKGCYNLVEVFNLSALPLEKGSDEYGGVAKYAEVLSSAVLPSVVESQDDFRYIVIGEETVLLGYVGHATGLVLPDDLDGNDYVIHAHAFDKYMDLTSVTFVSGVKSIGDGAFMDCTKLETLDNLGAVKTIGDEAFSRCSKLASLTIGEGTQIIGSNAFFGCYGLVSVSIPQSVTSIGENAFYACSALVSITVNASNANYSSEDGVLFDKGKTVLIKYPQMKAGTTYTIPDTVVSIALNAFLGCSKPTSISIPNNVQSIGEKAFYNCAGVTTVTIGTGVTSIGNQAFSSSNAVESFTVDPANANYLSDEGVLYDKGKTALIQYPAKKGGTEYAIPDTVVSIGDYAFYMNSSLVNVTIGNSVTSIGLAAFQGCTSLAQVAGGAKVSSIGDNAFTGCSNLVNAHCTSSAVTIGVSAFQSCSKLGSVDLRSVVSIGNQAFYYCSSLETLVLPDSLTSMGNHAFSNCSSLVSVKLSAGLTVLNQSTFANCPNIVSVTISDKVELIDISAFSYCAGLKDVIISDSVKVIKDSAFKGCPVWTVYFGSGLTTVQENAFSATFYESDETTVVDKTADNLRNSMFGRMGSKTVRMTVDVTTEGSVSSKTSDTDSAAVSQNDIAFVKKKAASNADATLQINLKDGMVASFDAKAITALGDAPTELKVESVDKSTLSEEDRKVAGDNPVFEITFGSNTNFGDGKATFTVPYTLPSGKSADKVKVYCIKDGAVAETIDGTYADGKVTFGTNHLSLYSIGAEDSDDGGKGGFPIWIVAVIAVVVIAAAAGAFFVVKKKKA